MLGRTSQGCGARAGQALLLHAAAAWLQAQVSTAGPGRHSRSSQTWPFLECTRKLAVLNFSFYLPGPNVGPEHGSKKIKTNLSLGIALL